MKSMSKELNNLKNMILEHDNNIKRLYVKIQDKTCNKCLKEHFQGIINEILDILEKNLDEKVATKLQKLKSKFK